MSTNSQSRHYTLLVFLMLLNIMNFVDRQLLASFANFIKPELNLTDTQFGLLTGLVFIFFYATMGLFAGALADRVHRPRLIAVGVALWSVLTAASGAAKGFMSLALPRLFIGVGESVLTPTALSLLADRFPAHRLGFASGFYYLGVPVGIGASFLVAGYLGPVIGWRNCFYLLGAIGVVLAALMLLVSEKPDHGKAAQAAALNANTSLVREVLNALKSSKALTLTIAGGVCFHFILGAANFDQLWYVQERGFEKADILITSGWIATGAGIVGTLFGGLASDWWQKTTGQGRPTFLFWVMLIGMPIYVMYRFVEPASPLFWIGLGVGFFMLGSFYGPTFSTVQELSPPNRRGTIVAFYILMLNLIGLGIGVSGAGIAIDLLRDAGYAEPYTIVLVSFTFLSSLALPLFYLAGKAMKQERPQVNTT